MPFAFVISFFIYFMVSTAQANCEDPVPNQYLIVTKTPEKVLEYSQAFESSKRQQSKTFNITNPVIFDHRLAKINYKTGTSSKAHNKNLDYSTLLLVLSKNEVHEIKQLRDTTVSNNCFIDIASSETPTPPSNNLNPFLSNFNDVLVGNVNSDPLYDSQWGLKFLNSDLPFELIQPIYKTVVAISDTGFDFSHEDLHTNLWINTAELNGTAGVDDDKNGCVDDIYGCDVTQQNGDIGINKFKTNLVDHGTHVAGIIGATINNQMGIAGASFNSEIMLIKAFASHRKTTAADLLKSIYYAVDNKADVLNCSWESGSLPTLAEFNAFEYARVNNTIVVAAAGNSATYASKTSPAGLSNVLTVGSHNSNEQLSTFSNFGEAVDLLAPGGDGVERRNDSILSLGANSNYIAKKGTSMAAPYVVAVIANLKSIYPNLKRTEILNILLMSSKKKNVQGFFDPKYKDELRFIDFAQALHFADEYTKNQGQLESLDFEPKPIIKPYYQNPLDVDSNQDLFQSEAHGSGCSNSNLKTKAGKSSWLLLFLPLISVLIKKRTLKRSFYHTSKM